MSTLNFSTKVYVIGKGMSRLNPRGNPSYLIAFLRGETNTGKVIVTYDGNFKANKYDTLLSYYFVYNFIQELGEG
jgi:hypothetical protein